MTEPDISLRDALADRYRIGEQIGAGGMATVYVAEGLRHRRRVAIKVLRPELAESLGAERFLKEIETTANLRHSHILPPWRVQRELDGDPRYAQRAVIAYLLRDAESTYELLELAVESRDGDLLWVLTSVPYLEPLRGEDRFQALLRRVGLT